MCSLPLKIAEAASAIKRETYSASTLEIIRSLIDDGAGKEVIAQMVEEEKSTGLDAVDAINSVNRSLEALEWQDGISARILMAFLTPLAGPLYMHWVCDSIDLYMYEGMSDALRNKLLTMASQETDRDTRRQYEKWSAYKSVE